MYEQIDCTTQAELDAAIAARNYPNLVGDGYFTAYGSATVRAYGSATVTAYGSATVRAYDSATVTAYDSATVRAYGSATVRAYGSATVRAYGSATVTASKYVPVQDHGPNVTVSGGVLISIRRAESPEDWCDFYGVEVVDGIAVLFKAVDDDWKGAHKTAVSYEPGQVPVAPDWRPVADCGFGLHFSPHPWMAEAYNPTFTRYVACPVALTDMVLLDDKIKAPRCVGPVVECDIDGAVLVSAKAVA